MMLIFHALMLLGGSILVYAGLHTIFERDTRMLWWELYRHVRHRGSKPELPGPGWMLGARIIGAGMTGLGLLVLAQNPLW